MATPTGPNLISRKEHRAILATNGLNTTKAYDLCRIISNTEGWYARMVPAWQKGTPPTERLFWVKCCRWKGHPQSRWYYLDMEEQWHDLRTSLETPDEPAKSVSEEHSTSSVTGG